MSAMTAPLSLFLTRFAAPPPVIAVEIDVPVPEPTITMTLAELDARLETATQTARCDAEQRHTTEVASLVAKLEAAQAASLMTARAEWAATAGEHFSNLIEVKLSELRAALADRVADVLRPLLAEAVRMRTVQAVYEAIDRLLADPAKPAIRVSGPDDLVAHLRAGRPTPGIEWVVADLADVTLTAGATHIETRLAAAMAEIATTETSDVG